MLAQLDVDSRKTVDLQFTLEHADSIIDLLRVEISIDGYNWVRLFFNQIPFEPVSDSKPQQTPRPSAAIQCHYTSQQSTLPHPSLPRTFMSSQSALSALAAERAEGRPRRKRLQQCTVTLTSSVGGSRRKGWRFVRLRSEAARSIGWGVYDISID